MQQNSQASFNPQVGSGSRGGQKEGGRGRERPTKVWWESQDVGGISLRLWWGAQSKSGYRAPPTGRPSACAGRRHTSGPVQHSGGVAVVKMARRADSVASAATGTELAAVVVSVSMAVRMSQSTASAFTHHIASAPVQLQVQREVLGCRLPLLRLLLPVVGGAVGN